MAIEVSFGIASIEKGDIDAVTGLPSNLQDVGDVYRDSVSMETPDHTTTDHFPERGNHPLVRINRKALTVFKFTLMDTQAATLVQYLGGEVTEVAAGNDIWEEPLTTPKIENSFVLTTDDGKVFTIHRGDVVAKLVPNPTKTGVHLLEVMVTVMKPKVAGVSPFVSKNAIATA